MKIKEIMIKFPDIVTCAPTASVTEAAKKMENFNVGCILVVEDGSLKGILTDRDITLLVAAQGKNPHEVQVQEIMKPHVITGNPEWDLYEAAKLMADKKIRRLPITANGRLSGFLSSADIAKVIQREVDSIMELEASLAR